MGYQGWDDNQAHNVLGEPLTLCCDHPITGYFRDGFCHTNVADHGIHTVCVEVTKAFLAYSKQRGNDLSTPRPEFQFPGLQPGDHWCLCAARWAEALADGVAPKVDLSACHERTLEVISLADLIAHQLPSV